MSTYKGKIGRPRKTPRGGAVDRSLDILDRWMRDQLTRVARKLQEDTEDDEDKHNDGMERYHINRDTVITRRQ